LQYKIGKRIKCHITNLKVFIGDHLGLDIVKDFIDKVRHATRLNRYTVYDVVRDILASYSKSSHNHIRNVISIQVAKFHGAKPVRHSVSTIEFVPEFCFDSQALAGRRRTVGCAYKKNILLVQEELLDNPPRIFIRELNVVEGKDDQLRVSGT
jgi:hypothetical protein